MDKETPALGSKAIFEASNAILEKAFAADERQVRSCRDVRVEDRTGDTEFLSGLFDFLAAILNVWIPPEVHAALLSLGPQLGITECLGIPPVPALQAVRLRCVSVRALYGHVERLLEKQRAAPSLGRLSKECGYYPADYDQKLAVPSITVENCTMEAAAWVNLGTHRIDRTTRACLQCGLKEKLIRELVLVRCPCGAEACSEPKDATPATNPLRETLQVEREPPPAEMPRSAKPRYWLGEE